MLDMIRTAYGFDTDKILGGPELDRTGPLRYRRETAGGDLAGRPEANAAKVAGRPLQAHRPQRDQADPRICARCRQEAGAQRGQRRQEGRVRTAKVLRRGGGGHGAWSCCRTAAMS